MRTPHPAVEHVLADATSGARPPEPGRIGAEHTTSPSLAHALAIGCLGRLNPRQSSVDIWDPAVGSGYAGALLVGALQAGGVQTRYRGQDIDDTAVRESRRRFEADGDAEIAHGDTLESDAFEDFVADLVIVDGPWGVEWKSLEPTVRDRHKKGAFRFGLPQRSDSTWLFVSLALEKLRPTEEGGGRVAALVHPGALSSTGASAVVRRRIVEAGLLESVTRLPHGLAPSTGIPLYLLTFSNRADDLGRGKAVVADLQTLFTARDHRRSMPAEAFRELESALRTRRSGPRNRFVGTTTFIRRDARLTREARSGQRISWPITTYNDTSVDERFVESRYGRDSGVVRDGSSRETVDLNPSHILTDDTRELVKDMEAKGWPCRRLSGLLAKEVDVVDDPDWEAHEGQVFVPTTRAGHVADEVPATETNGRVLSIELDDDTIQPAFLVAWLNTEQGVASHQRAIDASSSGTYYRALRSDGRSLMRWADELLVPVPSLSTQSALASADERLGSFQAELRTQRSRIWTSPETADEIVNKVASAFDDSLRAWLDQLPFPVATALWTAETAASPGEQQRAYLQAWEAIATFHATVLLSASRQDPGGRSGTEAVIRQTLQQHGLGIERPTFKTWVIIAEKISKEFRTAIEGRDADDIARIRRAFGDLSTTGIERLTSKDIVKKLNEVNAKRNRWLGHSGFTPDEEREAQVDSLLSDLRDLRVLIGDAWAQLRLVRAGSADRTPAGYLQTAEVAVGTRTPFATEQFRVGDSMMSGELYLVRDGSESPLPLGQFIQLRGAPRSAQFTTYFYNRTEGSQVRMVSYQHGPESEIGDDVEKFRDQFGELGSDATPDRLA